MNANDKQAWADKIKKDLIASINAMISGTRDRAVKAGKSDEIEAVIAKAMAIIEAKDAEYWTNYANPHRVGGFGVNTAKNVWQEAVKKATAQ